MKSRRFTWGMGLLLLTVFRTPLHPRLQNLLAQLRCLTMPNDQVAKTTGLTIAPHHSQGGSHRWIVMMPSHVPCILRTD
jgi:hypothetical protein